MSSSTTAGICAARLAIDGGSRMTAAAWLRVALLAGLVAALAAMAFELAVAERVVDRAIVQESSHEHAERAPLAVPEPFSRRGQRGGLVLGELLLGCGIAFLLAGAATFLGGRSRSPLRLWVWMGLAGIVGVVLLPALVYPPLPPGVASGLGIDERQFLYLLTVGLGIGAVAAAAHAVARAPRRLSVVGACIVVPALVALVALPDQEAAHTIAPRLLAEFRLVSIASQLIFWGTLVAAGALLLRRREAPVLDGAA